MCRGGVLEAGQCRHEVAASGALFLRAVLRDVGGSKGAVQAAEALQFSDALVVGIAQGRGVRLAAVSDSVGEWLSVQLAGCNVRQGRCIVDCVMMQIDGF